MQPAAVTSNTPKPADLKPIPPPLQFPSLPSSLPPQEVVAKYDKFKDQWVVVSKPVRLDQERPKGAYDIRTRPLFMNIYAAVFRSRERPAPLREEDKITLVITSRATDWQFLGDHTLRLIVDGLRYQYHTVRTSQVSPLTETLWADLPLREFLQIAVASTIEGQIGSQEFSISSGARRTLANFASVLPLNPNDVSGLAEAPPVAAETDSDSQAAPRTGKARFERIYEQVFADAETRLFYPSGCIPRPPKAYRLPKAMAIRQGFTIAPQCATEPVPPN